MSKAAIRMEHLVHEFGSVRAVDGLTLDIEEGIMCGFLGPNGAGKTTTIRLLLGLLEPTAGQAKVLGYDIRTQGDEIRQHTGALLEQAGVYEGLSAEDNMEFYGRVWRLARDERRARIKELLTQMGLWQRRTDRVGTWSRGMKQKLALARALLHRPRLVLLDEPTAGLDVAAAAAVREDLATLVSQEGVTVLLTTHNMAEAEKLCSQVAVIRQGRLIAHGHPDELRARAGSPRVEVHGRGFSHQVVDQLRARPEVADVRANNGHLDIDLRWQADPAPLISLLVRAGADVTEVQRGKASLEEVFLTLMSEESQPAQEAA
jgi:ABC-2 type transport system ATP-binding protein